MSNKDSKNTSGDWNSGNQNSGHWNCGNRNSGNRNTGDFNSCNYSSGFFNSKEQTVWMFNKDTGLTRDQIKIPYIILPLNAWVSSDKMTDQEKSDHPEYEITGGFLKTVSYKDAWKIWWDENPNRHQEIFDLPNFDSEVFEEITGIGIK